MTSETKTNIAQDFFTDYKQIQDNDRRPLANIYWKSPDVDNVHACLYLFHGYGGSPVEPCLKLPMQYALDKGMTVVAIEGVDLSATSGTEKNVSEMTLQRQKQALDAGIHFCKQSPQFSQKYNIAWAHSISCRALSDLILEKPDLRHYFNEIVLNNPYFLPPPKVYALRDKVMRKDPTGQTWALMMHRLVTRVRTIENRRFSVPTCLYNLAVPLPNAWRTRQQDLQKLARIVSRFITDMRMCFVLGTGDDNADYNQNMQLFQGLAVPAKQALSIPGANHSFENAQAQYLDTSRLILDGIIGRTRHTM